MAERPASGRRVVRFMPEWGAQYPLFESGHENYATEPADYDLSEGLARRLARWTAHWQHHMDEDGGWHPPEAEAHARAESEELLRLVTAEVAGFAEVVDERDWLWTPPWWRRLPLASWIAWEWTRRRRGR